MEKNMNEDFLKSNAYVDVYELSRTKDTISGRVLLSDMPRLQDLILQSNKALQFTICGIVGKEGWPGATVTLSGDVPLVCNRCNQPMSFEMNREVVFRFAKSESEANQIPIEEDDDIEIVVGSTKMNLLEWLEEEALLSLPLVPMHLEQCIEPLHIRLGEDEENEKKNPFAQLKEMKNLRKAD